MGTGVERRDAVLATRLDPTRLTATRQDALLDQVTNLIAAETIRYFEFQLDTHNLPPVPDNHRARMTQAATRLGVDPFTTSRPHISQRLPAPAGPGESTAAPEAPRHETQPQPDEQAFTGEEDLPDEPVITAHALRLLADPPQPYDPAEVRQALQWVANGDIDTDSTLRRAAKTVIEVYDAVAACTSEPYAPVVAAAAAVNLVPNDPAPSDAEDGGSLYRGEILAQAIDLATMPDDSRTRYRGE